MPGGMFIPNQIEGRDLPEPTPFDVDHYLKTYMSEEPTEDAVEKYNAFGRSIFPFVKPFVVQGYNTYSALNRGTAAFWSHLDSIADYIEISSGMKSEGLFEDLAKIASDNADYWRKRAEKIGIGFVDEMVSEAVGGFAPGVTQFAMDVGSGFTFPYMAGAAEAYKEGESPFEAGMVEAAKTATLSYLFRMMHPLKQYLRAPAFGTVFGVQEAEHAPEGQKAKAFAKGFGIGAMYSAASPGGRMGLNEVKEASKIAFENLKRKPAAESAFAKLQEQRGSVEIEPQKRQRKFLKTIEESKDIDPTLKEKVAEVKPQDYFVQPNVESFGVAKDTIKKKGLTEALEFARDEKNNMGDRGATYQELIDRYQKAGDFEKAVEIVEEVDATMRKYGQFIQTAAVWTKRASPQTFIHWANKQLAAVQNKYGWADTILRRKPEDFKLSPDEQKQIFEKYREIDKMDNELDRSDATLEMVDMVAQKVPPSVSELIDAYRYQNMLSSPKTQMRNIGENVGNTFLTRPIDVVSRGAIDFTKSMLTGKQRESYVKDVGTYYKSAFNAVPNASRAFWEVMKLSRKATIEKPEVGLEVTGAFSQARAKQLPASLTLVGRFMEASDKFNSALISGGEMARLMKNGVPEAEAYNRAHELAEQYLYREKLEAGDPSISAMSQALNSLGKMVEFTRKTPGLKTLSKWYVPFIRTPVNKAIQMVEHSPLGLVRDPKKLAKDREAQAKILSGTIMMAMGAVMAATGDTTWAPPANQDEKTLFYATGRKPFSFRIQGTDRWIPFWYLGPYALAFALPAAAKHYSEGSSKAVSKDRLETLFDLARGTAQFVGSQSSTQSIGALFSALHGDIDYTFSSQTGFTVQQIIPAGGLVRYVNTILDPVYRRPKGFMQRIEANLPVLSKNLEAYTNPYMEESMRDPVNYFLPYDTGRADERFEILYTISRGNVRGQAIQRRMEKEFEKKMDPILTKIKKAIEKKEEADTSKDIEKATKELMELTKRLNKQSLMQFQKEYQKTQGAKK